MKLTEKTTFQIVPSKPFHFDATFFKPAHYPSNDMKFEPGKRWQTMLFKEEKLGLIFENKGTVTKPKIRVFVFSKKKLSLEFIKSLKQEIVWRYNLNLNLTEFYKDVGKDKLLAPAVKKFRGLRPMFPGSLYEYLIIAITLQNAPVRRSIYMMQALFENYGALLEFADSPRRKNSQPKASARNQRCLERGSKNPKLWCFWEPEVLAKAGEQKLRDLKIGYRAKSFIKVSESFAKDKVNEIKLRKESLDIQIESLISLYGIGPASVGYIMFDVFHQWGFLNHISPWEQKIYSKIFFNKDPEKNIVAVEKMLKRFEKWGKWKNLAVHYVWEDIWWQRRRRRIPWLEKLVRL